MTVRSGRLAPVQVLINGDNANTATTVLGYAGSHPADGGGRVCRRAACIVQPPLADVEPRIWYNPELRSTLFLVPGLIAYIAHDHRRGVDGAVDRPREGDPGRSSRCGWRRSSTFSFIVGKTHSLLPDLARLGRSHHRRLDGAVRTADARQLARAAARAVALSRRRARARASSSRPSPRRSRWPSRWRCSSRSCRRSCCPASSFRSAACRQALQLVTYVVPARYFLIALRGIVLKGTELEPPRLPQLAALRSTRSRCSAWRRCACARDRG